MINYAHRGASEYAPENTLAAFYMGVEMGANGIETDVRLSLDGVPVLFHDSDMSRISTCTLPVENLTYSQLMEIDLGSWKHPRYKGERIVTLEDFLKYFSSKDLSLAIELKGANAEQKTLDLIYKYGCAHKVTITSFDLEMLKTVRIADDSIRLGYLTRAFNNDLLSHLETLRIGEVCPNAWLVSPGSVLALRSRGFTVRAYGITDEFLMEKCCNAGVDGMTVNFPDKLTAWMRAHGI